MSLFITGTDTDVGKTWVAAALVRAARGTGQTVAAMKPIACGNRHDAELLATTCGGALSIDEINPVWLQPAAAPYTAAMIEERVIDLALIRDTFARLQAQHDAVVVEGAGGWLVPILRDYAISDLAREFALPVVVVAANRLGVLNHALLTVESILAKGLRCAGVLLNQPIAPPAADAATLTNPGVLEDLLRARGIPYLGEMEHGSNELPLPAKALLAPSANCENLAN
jgi:dethiobiotin synthetase